MKTIKSNTIIHQKTDLAAAFIGVRKNKRAYVRNKSKADSFQLFSRINTPEVPCAWGYRKPYRLLCASIYTRGKAIIKEKKIRQHLVERNAREKY
jgi:hypothetical protein